MPPRARVLVIAASLLLAGFLSCTSALAQQAANGFDHLSTGFPLTGQHRIARCEDCHVRGIFKGTPTQCAACHLPGTPVIAVIMASNHFPTSQPCSACHTTSSFYGAFFPHTDVAKGTCTTCHNSVFAQGKPPGHLLTSASCDLCHTTVSFSSAYLTLPLGHIPTSQPCSTCHNPAAFVPGVMNHANTAGTCSQCHAASTAPYTFTIAGALTASGTPVAVIPTSQAGLNATNTGSPVNHIPTSASCDQCHTNGVFTAGGFKGGVMHHAAVAGEACASCHSNPTTFAGTGLGAGGQPFQIPAPVGTPGTADHIPIGTLDCGNSGCHSASDTTTATGTGFATHLVPALSAAGHQAVNLPCQSCHTVGMSWKLDSTSIVTPSAVHIPPDNTSGALGCASCHSATSFGTGGFHLGGTPGSAPVMTVAMHAAVAAAVPTCVSCHEANAGDLSFQGVLGQIYLRPNTGTSGLSLASDPAHGAGNALTGDCGSCHSTAAPFKGGTLPANHIKLITPTPSCADCHAGGYAPGITTMKHADAAGTCTSCHYTSAVFSGTGQGTNGQPWQIPGPVGTPGSGNHIPINGLDCATGGCHSVSDALSSTGAGFVLSGSPVLSAAGHAALGLACETCHTINMAWKLPAGVTLVTPATNHIAPDNTAANGVTCSACHLSTNIVMGGFHLSGTPGSSPVMTVAMHSAVASAVPACASCHEANSADLGFQGILGQIYLRPNTATSGLSLASDAAHGVGNALTGDCSGCHSTAAPFKGGTLPSNHIKLITPTPSCTDCHANGYAPGVSTMKHADASGTCASCHYTTTVFSGTGQGTNGQPWQIPGSVGTSGTGNHIPINGLDCATGGCHSVSDALSSTGAGFVLSGSPVLSAAGHAALGLACETCHTINMAWKLPAGVTLVTPATNHIAPDNTAANGVTCSACHLSTNIVMGGFHLSGTAGTSSPVMTVAMHSAVASAVPACASCHEANSADLGFQGILGQIYLRPNTATPGLSLANDPSHIGTAATADCGGCHTTTPPFSSAIAKPAGHIALVSTASCPTCHTTGVFNTVVLPMPHTGVVSGTCGSCHGSGLSGSGYLGPFAGPNTLGGSYTAGNLLFVPKQIISSPPIGASGGHVLPPSADDCSVCHLSTSAFGPGTAMVHTNISSGCASCHSNGAVWYGVSSTATMLVTTGGKVLSPLHVPVAGATNTACEMCHSTSVFTSFSGTTVNHSSGNFMTFVARTSATPTCKSCHGPSGATWYGVSLSTATVGSHQGSSASQDCIDCHSTSNFGGAAAAAVAKRPVARISNGPAMRPATAGLPSTGGSAQSLATPFTHLGVVPGTCASCHSATGGAPALPASHLPTALSCDNCHRTSAWLPAIFAHNAVAAGRCGTCHTGSWATAKPAAHMLTSRTCDSCHRGTLSWTPQTYSHLDTVYTPHPSSVRCVDCHTTNTEQIAWKYPNLKPGCAGCHGAQFGGTATVRRSKGPAAPQPRAPQ